MVSVLALCSDDTSLNPAEVHSAFLPFLEKNLKF